jgi:hypothetical protein
MVSFLAYLMLTAAFLGVGTRVALVIPTRGTRIGLGAVVFLALIVDGTWLIAPVMGWSSALTDGVWAGMLALLIVAVAVSVKYPSGFLGRPIRTRPGARDLSFLALVVAWSGALLLVLPVPPDTDAQGFGYLALTLREGRSYTSLAPWHPEIGSLYSPGFSGIIAHLSTHFDLGIHMLMLVFGAMTASLFVWTAYDLGCEVDGPRTGRGFMLASLIGTGLVSVFMDVHFTALLAIIFEMAFITFVVGFLRTGSWPSAAFAAICLAGVPLAHQDMAIAFLIGYLPWLVVIWFGRPRPDLRIWLGLAVIIPLAALVILSPWLISVSDLLRSNVSSPYGTKLKYWYSLTISQGGICVVLVGIGTLIGLRRRQPLLLWMVVWVVGLVEFSTLGVLEANFPDLRRLLFRYNYPLGLAWNGPLVPYTVLGGTALVWLADRIGQVHADRLVRRVAVPVYSALAGVLVIGLVFFNPLLRASKAHEGLLGCVSSSADVDAMLWLRDHTPKDARVLNHPGPIEGDWAPVIAERDTVYFRPQYFFHNTRQLETEQDAFRAFWNDPANPKYEDLFRKRGVTYVLVPQIFGDPGSFTHMIRWMRPLPAAAAYPSTPFKGIRYLQLVYEQDGAQVYKVNVTSTVTTLNAQAPIITTMPPGCEPLWFFQRPTPTRCIVLDQ